MGRHWPIRWEICDHKSVKIKNPVKKTTIRLCRAIETWIQYIVIAPCFSCPFGSVESDLDSIKPFRCPAPGDPRYTFLHLGWPYRLWLKPNERPLPWETGILSSWHSRIMLAMMPMQRRSAKAKLVLADFLVLSSRLITAVPWNFSLQLFLQVWLSLRYDA